MYSRILLAACVACLSTPLFSSPNWPAFRGADARGVSDAKGLPDTWDTKTNVKWVIPVAGRSWSSPIVWGNKVFMTNVVNSGKDHLPKKGLYFGGNTKDPIPFEHRWQVIAYDLKSGKELWKREVAKAKPTKPIHVKNTYASETPVADKDCVIAYFGNAGIVAYDHDGKLLWKKEVPQYRMRYGWGTAASPVLDGDRLYVINDNESDSWLAAYDKRTGKEVWKQNRKEKSNWSTPFVWKTEKRTEIITPGTQKVRSYGLDGKLLWELKGMSSITIATPFTAHGLLYVTSGYVGDRHRPIYAIKPGASGDISLKDKESSNSSIEWYLPKAAPYNPTTVVYGDYLYTLLDFGFFACYEAKTGKTAYGKTRLGVGMGFTASPWAYDGKIFCLNENGETLVIKAGPKYELIRKNSLDEMCMATPAIAGKNLLIRTLTKLYCISAEK
ncbi:MAG: PQQ-binding-like beta-propeller repeat protein [Planctomycetota bacterium]